MAACHHCITNPREIHFWFPKIVTGHGIGLLATPKGTHSQHTASADAGHPYLTSENNMNTAPVFTLLSAKVTFSNPVLTPAPLR